MSHSYKLPSANALSALQHHLSGTLSLSLFRTVTRSHYSNLDLKHICSPPSLLFNCPVRQRLWSHGNMALYKFCIVLYCIVLNTNLLQIYCRVGYWKRLLLVASLLILGYDATKSSNWSLLHNTLIPTFWWRSTIFCLLWTSPHCKAYPFGMHPSTGYPRKVFHGLFC